VREVVRDLGIEQAVEFHLEREGQVPVIERDPRRDAVGQEGVDEAVVEGDAGLVDRAAALRDDAAPRDGEAIGLEAHRLHQGNILVEPMVMVARHVGRVPLMGLARGVREGVPDAEAPAVLEPGALDLMGGRGRAPHEPFGKCCHASLLGDRRGRCNPGVADIVKARAEYSAAQRPPRAASSAARAAAWLGSRRNTVSNAAIASASRPLMPSAIAR